MRVRWHLRRAGGSGTVGVNLPSWVTAALSLRAGQRVELEVRDDAMVVYFRRATSFSAGHEEDRCLP